jgi:predicted DsbA family dithiol-disulfide isomerase
MALMDANFHEGRNISDKDVLAEIAARHALAADEVVWPEEMADGAQAPVHRPHNRSRRSCE